MRPADLSHLLHQALEERVVQLVALLGEADILADPEGLRRVRVASRRLRAALDWANPDHYDRFRRQARRAKALGTSLGAMRELEVCRLLLVRIAASLPPEGQAAAECALDPLDEALARARNQALEAWHPEETRRLAALRHRRPQPPAPEPRLALQEALWQELQPRLEGLEAIQEAAAGPGDAETLHALRIRLKRLRYALEVVAPALGPRSNRALASLKALQDALGSHHDHWVLAALLHPIHTDFEARGRHTLARGMGQLLAAVEAETCAAWVSFRALGITFNAAAFRSDLRPAPGDRP